MSGRVTYTDADLMQHQFSQFREVLNVLPAAVYLCDQDGYITFYNEAAARLWERRPVIGKDLWCGSWRVYAADGRPISLDECPMAITLKTRKPVLGSEVIIEQSNGVRLNVLPHPYPLFDPDGNFTGAINMLVDVTGHRTSVAFKETLDALKRSEERYNSMIGEIQDYAIIRLSVNGVIEHWNNGAERIKGYTEHEILGKNFRIFYPPEDQANGVPERLLQTALIQGKAQHEGWRVKKDGTRFWGSTSITALHGSQGNVTGFSKVTRDLTERRKHEVALQEYADSLKKNMDLLRESEDRYHRMIAEVEDYVIILISPEGIVENWNRGAEKIKGYKADEIVGRHFSVFYPEEDVRSNVPGKLLAQAAKNGRALHEGWRRRKDGSMFWGSIVLTAIHSAEGKLLGYTKVTRDLTEKKITDDKLVETSQKLEEKNRELERKNEELSSFAYISSHDLQEPLRKIQTFSDRIMELEYDRLSEKGKDYFLRMQRGASRMQQLIQDILAYSRTNTGEKKFEVANLNELLRQSMQELEVMIGDKHASIEHGALPELSVIPYQIVQLFTNLLNNALKFSKNDTPPRILINASLTDARELAGEYTSSAKKLWRISFHDNGIGFETIYARKIFEVFQRLHGRMEYGGTGIGLAICKKIVENHQGVILAESEPGKGSVFHVYLPATDKS